MNFRRLTATGCVTAFCLCAAVPISAQESVGERIGEKVNQVIGSLREEAKEVAGQIREGFGEARVAVERMSVVGRVYARLHWDKALHDASISVDVAKDGLTTLRGSVPDEAAKAKATQLAGDTIGVQQVVNELKVEPRAVQ